MYNIGKQQEQFLNEYKLPLNRLSILTFELLSDGKHIKMLF